MDCEEALKVLREISDQSETAFAIVPNTTINPRGTCVYNWDVVDVLHDDLYSDNDGEWLYGRSTDLSEAVQQAISRVRREWTL